MFSGRYQDPQGRFSFEVPSGWKVQTTGGNATFVTDGDASYVSIVYVPGGGQNQRLVKNVTDQIGAQWKRFEPGNRGSATLAGQKGIFAFYNGINPKGVSAIMRVVAAPFGDDAYMLIISTPTADLDNVKASLLQIENTFAIGSGVAVNSRAATAPSEGSLGEPPASAGAVLSGRGAPKGFQSADGPKGGRVLYGALGGVASGQAAVQSGMGRMHGYFDSSPKLISAVGSKNKHDTLIVFRAFLNRQPVSGLFVANYDPAGNSRFAAAFDDPAHLSKSLPSMMSRVSDLTMETLDRARPKGGKAGVNFASYEVASKRVPLKRAAFPDGTATVGIASGFTPQMMGGAAFKAAANDGAFIHLFVPYSLLDPRGSLYKMEQNILRNAGGRGGMPGGQLVAQYDSNPVTAWKSYLSESARAQNAAPPDLRIERNDPLPSVAPGWTGRLVNGTLMLGSEPMVFAGMLVLGPQPGPDGGWSLQVTLLGAPLARAESDMPALIAMQNSIKVDMKAVINQTNRNIDRMAKQLTAWLAASKAANDDIQRRRFESSMKNAQASREAMDRSTAGFIHYISDKSVLGITTNGTSASPEAHVTVDKNFASALEQADPQHFSVVSIKDYVKGVDY